MNYALDEWKKKGRPNRMTIYENRKRKHNKAEAASQNR